MTDAAAPRWAAPGTPGIRCRGAGRRRGDRARTDRRAPGRRCRDRGRGGGRGRSRRAARRGDARDRVDRGIRGRRARGSARRVPSRGMGAAAVGGRRRVRRRAAAVRRRRPRVDEREGRLRAAGRRACADARPRGPARGPATCARWALGGGRARTQPLRGRGGDPGCGRHRDGAPAPAAAVRRPGHGRAPAG